MPASRRSFASRSQRWPRTLWSAEVPHPKAYRVHLGRTCRSTSQPIDAPGAWQTACGAPCPRATVLRSSERESAQDAHGHRDAPCDWPPSAHVKEQCPHRERASHAAARIPPDGPRKLALARTPALSRIRDGTLASHRSPRGLAPRDRAAPPSGLAPRATPRGLPLARRQSRSPREYSAQGHATNPPLHIGACHNPIAPIRGRHTHTSPRTQVRSTRRPNLPGVWACAFFPLRS